MDNDNINYINVLNILKEKNKIYLEVVDEDYKSYLVGVDYSNNTVTSKVYISVDATDIIVSEDEQRIAYRKNTSSLYIADLDGSNEKVILEGINKGENPDTTGYTPEKFIDNNKILYTCIGWEHTRGCGIIDINIYGYAGYCQEGVFKIDMNTGNEENIIPIPEEEKSYVFVDFSESDNKSVAFGKEDGNVDIYNLETKQLQKEICIENARINSIHLVNEYIYIRYAEDAENFIVREKIH